MTGLWGAPAAPEAGDIIRPSSGSDAVGGLTDTIPRTLRHAQHAPLRPLERRTDAYRFSLALLLVLLALVLDFANFFERGSAGGGTAARYLVLAFPLAAVVFSRHSLDSRIRTPLLPDVLLGILAVYGLAGSLYGRLFVGTVSTALPLFLPMMVGLLHVGTAESLNRSEARKVLRGLAWIGVAFTAMATLAGTGAVPAVSFAAYGHGKAFFLALALSAAALAGGRTRPLAMLAAAVFIFVQLPAATYAVVAAVTALTLFVTRPGAGPAIRQLVPFAASLIGLVALINLGTTVTFAGSYFAAVGKQDNTVTRLALWQAGIDGIADSPIFGSGFSGELVVSVNVEGSPFKAPLHNDYLLIGIGGGLLALLLFLGWVVATNVAAVRRYWGFVQAGETSHAHLLRALLVGYNAWLATAMFNPLFQNAGSSLVLFTLYALMMETGERDELPSAASGAA